MTEATEGWNPVHPHGRAGYDVRNRFRRRCGARAVRGGLRSTRAARPEVLALRGGGRPGVEANAETRKGPAWWAWPEMTRELDSGAVVDREPRCRRCNKKLAVLLTRPWEIVCVRCNAKNQRSLEAPTPAG